MEDKDLGGGGQGRVWMVEEGRGRKSEGWSTQEVELGRSEAPQQEREGRTIVDGMLN